MGPDPGMFRALIERCPMVSFVCDEDNRITYISPQIEEWTGLPARLWTEDPTHWHDMLHPDDRERVVSADFGGGTLDKIAGGVIIALGVLFLLTPFVPKLNREWRPDALISRAGSGGPLIAGAAFAWTPCIGPTLGAILTAASTQDNLGDGAVLLLFYSLGLSVPFLLTALAFTRAWGAFRWLRDRYVIITAVSGVVLIAMGVLLLTGELTRLNGEAQQALDSLGLNLFDDI